MPFKTKAKKTRASQLWIESTSSGQFSYLGKQINEDVQKEVPVDSKRKGGRVKDIIAQSADSDDIARHELIKIAILAILIIGLQLLIRVSHIGF